MPELPEVENFALKLNGLYAGLALKSVSYHRDDIRFPLDKKALKKFMKSGSLLKSVRRVGKQLEFEFEAGSVYFSLGMSGAFVPTEIHKPFKHEHLTLSFQGKVEPLGFVDPRRFGFITVNPPTAFAANPLQADELLKTLLFLKRKPSQRKLRDVLLDQTLIGGLGNIYACEACFLAGVRPDKKICLIEETALRSLASEIPKLLGLAIELGGSSISTYRTFSGAKGSFQNLHQVYGREGQNCMNKRGSMLCSGKVVRTVLGGRGLFFCDVCQK